MLAFIAMNIYILKGTNFKTFLKENYAIALDSCYLCTSKNVERKIDRDILILKLGLHTLDIPDIYSRFNEYLAI